MLQFAYHSLPYTFFLFGLIVWICIQIFTPIFLVINLFNYFIFVEVEEKKEKTLEKILSAKTKIRYEIQELNERLKQKKESIQVLKDHLEKLEDADVTDVENVTWIDGLEFSIQQCN